MWLWTSSQKASPDNTAPSDASSSVGSPVSPGSGTGSDTGSTTASSTEPDTASDTESTIGSTTGSSTEEASQESTDSSEMEDPSTFETTESSSDESSQAPIRLPTPGPSYIPKPARMISLISVVVITQGDFPESFTVYGDTEALRMTSDSWDGAMLDVRDIPDELADLYSIIPPLQRYMPRRVRVGKRRRTEPLYPWPAPDAETYALDKVFHVYVDIP